MTGQSLSIAGEWQGTFAYPEGAGPTTPFVAVIEQTGRGLSGTIIEPNTMTPGYRSIEAVLSGLRDRSLIDFTKTYPGGEWGYENPVDYVGSLSSDGLQILGTWSLLDLTGTFEMHRDGSSQAEHSEELEQAMPNPLSVDS